MSITTKEINGQIYYGVKCDNCGKHHHHAHTGDWHTIHKEAIGIHDGWKTYGGFCMETTMHLCPECEHCDIVEPPGTGVESLTSRR